MTCTVNRMDPRMLATSTTEPVRAGEAMLEAVKQAEGGAGSGGVQGRADTAAAAAARKKLITKTQPGNVTAKKQMFSGAPSGADAAASNLPSQQNVLPFR